jgi:ligand-binding SRPBCC domain-containing protein
MQYTATYSSQLNATPLQLWEWMTSFEGISREMSPLMRMTAPAGVTNLQSLSFEPGKPIYRSWLLLFKFLPFDFSDFTLEKVEPIKGFVEQSTMGSMRLWRHVRRIEPAEQGCVLTDELTYEPRFAGFLASLFVRLLFNHRHKQLRKHFGATQ